MCRYVFEFGGVLNTPSFRHYVNLINNSYNININIIINQGSEIK